MARPGKAPIHHCSSAYSRPWEIIRPQSGVGGFAQADEAEAGHFENDDPHVQSHLHDDGAKGVGDDVPEHDHQARDAHGATGLDVPALTQRRPPCP